MPSICDHPSCNEVIDRGLSYVCGNEPYGGERGCGLFFCEKHQTGSKQLCPRCRQRQQPYTPTPDTAEWVEHKLTHESWAPWRAENQQWVKQAKAVEVGNG